MKYNGFQRGIIKSLVVVVIGVCGMFVVLAMLVKYIQPNAMGSWNSFSNFTPINNSLPRQNSLIDFGNSGGTTGTRVTSGGGISRTTVNPNTSPYANKVSLTKGNTNTAQPHEEYVNIRNSGTPVDITGWTLTNNKGTKPIQNSQNSYFYPTADVAVIGRGTEYLDPSGAYNVANIVLKTGDIAYVITGGPFTQYSFPLSTSFKENICTGYLKVYPFTPQLSRSCPYIKNDPAINTITDQCYDYATRITRCLDPEKDDKKRFDLQTTQCKDFLTTRLNYPSCYIRNKYEPDFLVKKWRVFLGQKREMWASRRETITLYDKSGLIVDQVTY